jgi:hypothetical protein
VTSVERILSSVMDASRGGALPTLLCEDCAAAIPVSGVGLALMTDSGHQGVLAASDRSARLVEDLQFELGEGPCLDASRSRMPVLLPDLARTAASRWPGFGPAALDAGIAAIFALPLQVGAIRLGTLSLYRNVTGPLEDDQLAQALAYADAAIVTLLRLQDQMSPGRDLHPQLGKPLEDRAEIHQATGVISVQASITLIEALLLLRAHAYSADRPILDVARDVMAKALRFGRQPDEDGYSGEDDDV